MCFILKIVFIHSTIYNLQSLNAYYIFWNIYRIDTEWIQDVNSLVKKYPELSNTID